MFRLSRKGEKVKGFLEDVSNKNLNRQSLLFEKEG